MRVETLRHDGVRLDGLFRRIAQKDSHAHEHVLRTFNEFAVLFQQVRAHECFDAKDIILKVIVLDDVRVVVVVQLFDKVVV